MDERGPLKEIRKILELNIVKERKKRKERKKEVSLNYCVNYVTHKNCVYGESYSHKNILRNKKG